jgi:rubrerythrin
LLPEEITMVEIALNADMIFEIAQKIEARSARFYRDAARKMDSPRKREFLTELAIMEEGHIADFGEIRKTVAELEAGLETAQENVILTPFLEAMMRLLITDLNTTSEESSLNFQSVKDILLTAIGMEKDSIIFYLAMKDGIPAGPERNKIDIILVQEKEHLTLLNGFLRELVT